MAFSEQSDPQVLIFPTAGPLGPNLTTAAAEEDAQNDEDSAGQAETDELPLEVQTNGPKVMQPETLAPQPPRGDGPANRPQVKHGGLIYISITYIKWSFHSFPRKINIISFKNQKQHSITMKCSHDAGRSCRSHLSTTGSSLTISWMDITKRNSSTVVLCTPIW